MYLCSTAAPNRITLVAYINYQVYGTLLVCVDLSSDQHDVTQEDQSGDRSVFKGENQCRVVLALYRWGVTVAMP